MRKYGNIALVAAIGLVLVSCGRRDVISAGESGIGLLVNRTACPAVATPVHTNEITIFNPRSSREASAIDATAVITNIRSTCSDASGTIDAVASFDVYARRTDPRGARQIVLPYFATVLRGNGQIVSKEIGRVGLNFADGEYRASTNGQASTSISRAAVTLPPDVEERLTRRRRPGDTDAALDPMADPTVRAAVDNITFELLIGFQLEPDQLEYNATR
ncbi:hypothetical protein HFP51_06060 [Parasphingopyxis sp. CP4]|uniref:hypothetical protein n=1 Tax=Parasphingopyxis sp. CP4 TaxID=2724527 RepID=UPI0015A4387A|nr:hypothetical protein [Parasphingopyxis sp. CP4]QLC21775.1 hypothetical protein HFP51_06060 [Parasphingopyxis sp. CP4]